MQVYGQDLSFPDDETPAKSNNNDVGPLVLRPDFSDRVTEHGTGKAVSPRDIAAAPLMN